ncbi:MAG: TIGR00730 family Rossman fold protein [Bacteroidota bacterium]|nr:TIGR00730 family Rossman fold protein [Bacteroidota bacterium]
MASYRSVTVYCSSSNDIDESYFEAARELGRQFARHHVQLVNGGGSVGLMGVMAREVHAREGRVIGVIPKRLKSIEGRAYDASDELILTETMRERKRIMYDLSDGYVALAGGYGTLEEFLEVLTLRKLGYHDRPIVLLNTNGFYDNLLGFFDTMTESGFAHEPASKYFEVVTRPEDVLPTLGIGE